jgi:hypothetical protein
MFRSFEDHIDQLNAEESLITNQHPRPIPPNHPEQYTREYFITIDSRDRNRTIWPSANNFQVKLDASSTFNGATIGRNFRNVKSLEVISVQFPNANNVLNEMYLYLCFPELDGVFESTSMIGTKAIAKLEPYAAIGNFVLVKYDTKYPKLIFPDKGLSRLTALTVEFRKYDGTLFNFGTDTTPPTTVNPVLQTSITLRVVVQVPNSG